MPIQLNTNAKIKIANAIINSIFELDVLEFKLICILASQKFEGNEKVYRVSANALGELMNLSPKNRYTQLHCICSKLLNRSVQAFIRKNKNKISWLGTPWFNFIYYDVGVVYFSFHPLLRPYITMFKSAYVATSRDLFISFRSIYSLRLYLFLRMWFNIGHKIRTLTIENLKMLFCNSVKYNSVSDFIRFCVLPAIAEIEKLSSLTVKVVPVKTKAKITKITFEMSEVVDTVMIDNGTNKEEKRARELMSQCRCSERTINRLMSQHSPKRIIQLAEYTMARDGIKNPAAYLTEMLKRSYEDSEPAVDKSEKVVKAPVPEQIEPSKEEKAAEAAKKAGANRLLAEISELPITEQEQLYVQVRRYCEKTKNMIYLQLVEKYGVTGCSQNEIFKLTYAKLISQMKEENDDDTSR